LKNNLLARFAENIFWLARYMERAENLARILEVTGAHSRDDEGHQDWAAILEMNADMERFSEHHRRVTVRSAARFYVLDQDNPTSIVFAVMMARENARAVRHLISTEMWTQINMLHARLKELRGRDIVPTRLAGLCGIIKEACQAHTGITEGTLYQDEGWSFYWMGKAIERADQTSRLVDIGYRRATLSGHAFDSLALESHWTVMLHSAAGYQAFCRTHRVRMHHSEVLDFLLLGRRFPRSIANCLDEAHAFMLRLRDLHGIDVDRAGLPLLDGLQARLIAARLEDVVNGSLHGFVDDVQRQLTAFTSELARSVFGHDF
jgi:uncharacterized alpha-E superfamily protein